MSTSLRKLLQLLKKYHILILSGSLMAAASSVLQLYIPILFGQAIDHMIEKGSVDFPGIIIYLKQAVLLLCICSLCSYLMNRINHRLVYSSIRDIRNRLMEKLQKLPLSYLDSHSIGDISGRMIADVDQLSEGLLLGFNQLVSGLMTIVTTLYFMFVRDIGISLLVVAMTPLSFLVAHYISSHSYEMFKKQTEIRGKQAAYINEMIGNQKIVKAFCHEAEASEHFFDINTQLGEYTRKAIFYSSLTNPATRAVNSLIYAVVALVAAGKILQGGLSIGTMSVLLSYANQYMKPFNDISSLFSELQGSLACADRIFELLEAKEETKDKETKLELREGRIDIKELFFSYDSSRKLIEHFNLHVDQGMKVAIVGPTGCGKTTFINLLMRFYDSNQGDILIDDQDIKEVSRDSLRQAFGMVLQDTWLKHGTVRENIIFGKQDASDEEIIQAARKAHSWSFIRRMPQGLDTIIDESSLSQGQKQLLCITRVMLIMPPMLILDEATSSIDTRTEIDIQKAFDQLMENRTSFVVAHRLSTIRNADIILVMKDGKIIEQGSHEELLKLNGFYRTLYESQFAPAEE